MTIISEEADRKNTAVLHFGKKSYVLCPCGYLGISNSDCYRKQQATCEVKWKWGRIEVMLGMHRTKTASLWESWSYDLSRRWSGHGCPDEGHQREKQHEVWGTKGVYSPYSAPGTTAGLRRIVSV